MADALDIFKSIEPEILVASFTPEGDVVFRNPAWLAVFGAQDRPWDRLLLDDRQEITQLIREAATGLLSTNQLFLAHLSEREEPLPVLLNILPVHSRTGDDVRISAVLLNGEVLAEPSTWTTSQTVRHRMENLGRMTMGIAHDFNNLLSAMLGHIELLKSTPGGDEGTALQEHLQAIEHAALDGATLVRKIQQYIRQEKQTDYEPLNLPTLIHDCVVLTRPYWYNEPRRQGIAIDIHLELDAVPPIMGAAAELRDVFVNLILNAVQAMPRGGDITIGTLFEPDRGVQVHITDTGTGMTDPVQERIFEPLFSTKGTRGTGMGLSVCYGIIQEHDGTIEVKSRPGFGTTFTLTLPPAAPPLEAPIPEPEAPSGRRVRILVVDDEPMVRTVLSRLLALKGHTVLEASSGAEALSLTESERFDLVFTDQGMPEMSGRQLARALRRRHRNLPILLLTGDTDAGLPDENVTMVMAKPFKLDTLEATIQQLLA